MPISASPTLPVKKIPVHIRSAQNRVIIKNGRVVNHDQSFYADVFIEDGIIKDIGENLIVPGGTKTIEARGKLVIPGGIDVNTHLESVFMGARTADDFHTGTKAAIAGGTTTVISSVQNGRNVSLLESFAQAKERAEKRAVCDYSFNMVVSNFNDKVEKEMETMVREHGVNSFIMYTTYRDLLMLKEDELIRAMRKCKELGCVAMVHAENGELIEESSARVKSQGVTGPEGVLLSRSEQLEMEATQRVISIAEELNCPCYMLNVMSRSSALAIANARRRGVVVYGEPLAAGLALDGSGYFDKSWEKSASLVTAPPLRDDPSTPGFLVDLLANGDLETVSSCHRAFSLAQKALGKDDFAKIPHGLNGVEERLAVVWEYGVRSGRMDPCRFVAVTSTNAARLFNMYPRKGRLEKGSDADICVWDPEAVRTCSAKSHHIAADVNIFEGMKLHGSPFAVISTGRVLLEDNTFNIIQGQGRYVERSGSGEYAYGRVRVRDGIKVRRVEREPYQGAVAEFVRDLGAEMEDLRLESQLSPSSANFHHRPLTKAGARNAQDSCFTIGGDFEAEQPLHTGRQRVRNPPGGKSSVVF